MIQLIILIFCFAIIIGAVIYIFVIIYACSRATNEQNKKEKELQKRIKKSIEEGFPLDEKVELKFKKCKEDGKYILLFYNPIYQEWWKLPDKSAHIYDRWSFQRMGMYGTEYDLKYNLNVFQCFYDDIEMIKRKFTTLRDIQIYFDEMNKDFEAFENYCKKKREEHNKLPNIILN